MYREERPRGGRNWEGVLDIFASKLAAGRYKRRTGGLQPGNLLTMPPHAPSDVMRIIQAVARVLRRWTAATPLVDDAAEHQALYRGADRGRPSARTVKNNIAQQKMFFPPC